MDRERVDRDSQVFGVHLRKTLATGIVSVESTNAHFFVNVKNEPFKKIKINK